VIHQHHQNKAYFMVIHQQQRGVALITVLLVVFIITMAATSLATLQQQTIRRSTLFQHQLQARLYTLAGSHWAGAVLRRDLAEGETDYLGEAWASLPPALPIEGGSLEGRIVDLQGRFNLNNLFSVYPSSEPESQNPDDEENEVADDDSETEQDPNADDPQTPLTNNTEESACGEGLNQDMDQQQCQILERLLEVLEIDTVNIDPILKSIADWLDKDGEPRFPDGAEDSEYVGLTPPYLTANRPFISVSELRLIKGIDAEVYSKLAPYLSALPAKTPLNVNTLTPPLLAALSDQSMSLEEAQTRLENPPDEGYKNPQEFLDAQSISVINPELLSVNSQYFLVQVEARVGEGRASLESVLQRESENKTRVLLQSFGNDDGTLSP
jgi:general secretion pathway protein K